MSRGSSPLLAVSRQAQGATYVSGPPRVRIPFVEKVSLGAIMIIAIVSPMGYVMQHLLAYRKREEAE